MEEIAIQIGNVSVTRPGGQESRTVNWTHDNPSTKTLEKISLRFTMASGNGYNVRVTEVISGSYSDRLTRSGSAASGSTLDLELAGAAWANKTSGTLTVVFSTYGSLRADYTNVEIVLTYRMIADPSTIVVQDAIAGQPQTVMISNTDPDVYHKVRWQYARNAQTPIDSGELTYNAATRNPAWAVPPEDLETLYAENTHSGTETGEVTVKTYTSDGSLIGTTTEDAVLYLPEAAATRPVVQFISENDEPDTVAQTIGDDYVQNHTILKRTVTADGYQGAGIAQIRLVTPDGIVTGNNSAQIEQLIRTAGSYAVEYHIIDTRGQTLVVPGETLTVLPYSDPAIASIQALRCDQNGNARDDGGYVWVEASATYTGSTVTYTAEIKEKTSGTVVDTDTLANGAGVLGGSLDEDTTYTVTVTAEDAYGVTASVEIEIGTATITFSRMAGGKGVAFGKKAERYGVEVNEAWPFRVHGAEILRLIMDIAHPVGSSIEASDASWDPNEAWPWTRWAQSGGKWVRGV